MRKVLIVAGILLAPSSSVYAKLGVGIAIKVVAVSRPDEKVWASELKEAIEARLNLIQPTDTKSPAMQPQQISFSE